VPDGLTVPRQPRRAVGEVTLVLLLADGEAEIRALLPAVLALAALRRKQRDDVITGREVCDALAHTLDDPRALVPEYRRRVAGRVGTGCGVEIRVADAARDEPDEHLARLGLGEVELLNLQGCPELLEDRRANSHRAILSLTRFEKAQHREDAAMIGVRRR
jgi:hypothetical protein